MRFLVSCSGLFLALAALGVVSVSLRAEPKAKASNAKKQAALAKADKKGLEPDKEAKDDKADEIEPFDKTKKEDAKAFLEILAKTANEHLTNWQENRHKAGIFDTRDKMPLMFWQDEGRRGEDRVYYQVTAAPTKEAPKARFQLQRVTRDPLEGFKNTTARGSRKEIADADKFAGEVSGDSLLYALQFRRTMLGDPDKLRKLAAFLYVNHFAWEGNAVLTALASKHPTYRAAAQAFIRQEHGWDPDLTIGPADIGPEEWVLSVPGKIAEGGKVTGGEAFDARRKVWQEWAAREVAVVVEDFQATFSFTYGLTLSVKGKVWSFAGKSADNIWAWSELARRLDETERVAAGSEFLAKELATYDSKYKPKDGAKQPTKLTKVPNNFYAVKAALAEIVGDLEAAKKAIDTKYAEIKAARKDGKGEGAVKKLVQQAKTTLEEVFPLPKGKASRDRLMLAAADPSYFLTISKIFGELSEPVKDHTSCNNAEFAEAAESFLTYYLNYFPDNFEALYFRGMARFSMKKNTQAREDFVALRDNPNTTESYKSEAKSRIVQVDKESTKR